MDQPEPVAVHSCRRPQTADSPDVRPGWSQGDRPQARPHRPGAPGQTAGEPVAVSAAGGSILTMRRLIAYAWASPVTGGALLIVLLGRLTGGRVRFVRGAVETHGGVIAKILRRGFPWSGPAA